MTAFPLILGFHKVDTRWELGITRLSPRRFAELMTFLSREGLRAVPLHQAVLTPKVGEFALLFDDAYEGLFEHAYPVLRSLGWPAAMSVVTDYIGRENTWDAQLGWRRFHHLDREQLLTLHREGWTLVSHTRTHPDLTRLNDAGLKRELDGSRQSLADLGIEVDTISYPFGRCDARVRQAVLDAGYRYGIALQSAIPGNLALPVRGVYAWDSNAGILADLRGHRTTGWRRTRLISAFSLGTILWRSIRSQSRSE